MDSETNLHYNWNRYYDPSVGRYITSDPIGLDDGPNPYAYVANNSIRYIDPFGLAKRDPNSEYCKSLARRIRNLEKELEKRYREFEEDKLGLPERIGPGEALSETLRGHKTKINETDSRLNKNLNKYWDECGPPPSPASSNNETCGTGCKTGLVIGGACLIAACAIFPEICLPVMAVEAMTR